MATFNISIPKDRLERVWWIWVGVLGAGLALGLFGAIRVLVKGLHVTGLSDQVPWGLWITQDLSAIATGAGAFTFSAIVYLFRIKKYQPIARAAVFVGFLGYSSAMLALAMDIGRPDRFWHPLVYWNVHSVLWEITWCVILYSTVLVLEFLPIAFEHKFFDRWPKVREYGDLIHKASPVFAAIGLGLSLLHQSSLGATYGVLSGRAIWYKPSLPVMFILSAVAGGISMTLLLTIMVGKLTRRQIIQDRGLRALGVSVLEDLGLGCDILLQPISRCNSGAGIAPINNTLHPDILVDRDRAGRDRTRYHPAERQLQEKRPLYLVCTGRSHRWRYSKSLECDPLWISRSTTMVPGSNWEPDHGLIPANLE